MIYCILSHILVFQNQFYVTYIIIEVTNCLLSTTITISYINAYDVECIVEWAITMNEKDGRVCMLVTQQFIFDHRNESGLSVWNPIYMIQGMTNNVL